MVELSTIRTMDAVSRTMIRSSAKVMSHFLVIGQLRDSSKFQLVSCAKIFISDWPVAREF